MRTAEYFSAVAWVPDDDEHRDWDDATAYASEWIEQQARLEGVPIVVATNAMDIAGFGAVGSLARQHAHVSRRASRDRVPRGRRGVLAYVPYVEELDFAMDLAQHSAIVVVETVGFPIAGWAAWLGATNLLTGGRTPPLVAPLHKAVERLAFYGNNGFDTFGKQQARRIVDDLSASVPDLDGSLITSAALAAGCSPRAVKKLGELLRVDVD
jgi:hypothetical protein